MATARDNRTADLSGEAASVTGASPRGRRFRPALVQTLATLVLLPVFIGLGSWQVQRAAEKQQLLEAESAARQAAPVPAGSLGPTNVPLHARASGQYDDHLFLLDNRVRNRQAGYEVLAPLRIADDEAVLVNLGWVSQGESRQQLPAVEVPAGTVHVTGLAMTPEAPPFALSDRETFATGWPKVVQTALPETLEKELGFGLRPVVLYPDGSEVAAHKVEVMHEFGPSRHHGYAAQWFGFAMVLIIVYLWHGLHRGRQRRN
ncbi:SURF1 family protein [Guyparkeria hydrothermalis]|uniref:SURF1 family protein n=1 Tax=Guyparkeria hydrothermalis TaxID=923 RepID=UPI002020E0E5|nr:SURF1 family protein [Guyparkeria hydrothermalis]MCL7744157.1 SURF1 family protein [Guyparkeria hydrothermalis]